MDYVDNRFWSRTHIKIFRLGNEMVMVQNEGNMSLWNIITRYLYDVRSSMLYELVGVIFELTGSSCNLVVCVHT